jgi:hypothetical protein
MRTPVVLITGASTGIGRATAHAFASWLCYFRYLKTSGVNSQGCFCSIAGSGCAHRMIATSCSDCLRPGVPIDRDHLLQAIATSLWTEVIGAVG